MNSTNSDVNVPSFSSRGLFTVESINGVTTVSLHHFPTLSSTTEADGIERLGINFNCVSVVPARSQQNELNLEVLLNYERELIRRGIYLPQQYTDHISQLGTAFTETQNQVLQTKSRKRLSQILQLESTKKLKQDSSKSPDSHFSESLGWCSLCEIDCITEVVLNDHILGKKHKQMLKKLKKGDIIGNLEKNAKQVKVGIRQKKHKRSPTTTNQPTVECKTCDKVFMSQDCPETHAKQLKTMKNSKASSKVNDDSKKCAFADGKNTMSELQSKRAKDKHLQMAKDDSNSDARTDKLDMKENAELKEHQQMEGAGMPPKKQKMSKKVRKFSKKECKICHVLVHSQVDFEAHIAGRKHARMLQISDFSASILKSKVNSKECANGDDKESVSSDYGLVVKDNVDTGVEDILELTDDGGLRANSDKKVLREKADIKEIDNENVDIPDGKDNKLELEVRNDNGNTETHHFDGKKDNKNDIYEFANTGFQESGAYDYGPLIKDDFDKTAEDKTILELKLDGGSKPEGKGDAHEEEED